MQLSHLAIGIISIAICTACQKQLSVNKEYSQVTSESIGSLMGKRIDLDGDYISLTDDGTFSGTWKDKPIAGNWEMRDGYWCRVLTVFHDQDALNKEDCQLWEIDGNALRGTRAKGTGVSIMYTVS